MSKRKRSREEKLKAHRLSNLRLRMKRKKLGLCVNCGREKDANRVYCRDCLRERAERRREKKDKGICADCSERAEPGLTLCKKHLEAQRRRTLKIYGTWEDYWKHRKRKQAEGLLNQYRLKLKDDNESLLKSEEFVRKFFNKEEWE